MGIFDYDLRGRHKVFAIFAGQLGLVSKSQIAGDQIGIKCADSGPFKLLLVYGFLDILNDCVKVFILFSQLRLESAEICRIAMQVSAEPLDRVRSGHMDLHAGTLFHARFDRFITEPGMGIAPVEIFARCLPHGFWIGEKLVSSMLGSEFPELISYGGGHGIKNNRKLLLLRFIAAYHNYLSAIDRASPRGTWLSGSGRHMAASVAL